MAQKAVKMPSAHGHTAGIFADMSVDGPQIGTLVIIFDRAKNLPNRKTLGKQNPYVAARLGKEAKKTDTDMRGGQTPRWDQEIRYTVHESPDYLQLKVSVFNDDKKTDLIGETWVDLSSVIIPGGGQSDSWHELRYRNKYAGDIRLEMTYYDTRPEDEAVIERRTVVTEKSQSRSNNSAATVTPTSSSSLSGPRQPRPIKRRPLPDDPTGTAPSQAPPAAALPPATSAAPPQEVPIPAPIYTQPPRPNPDPRQAARQTQDARPVSRHNETPSNRGGLQMNHYAHDSPAGGPIPLDQFDDLNHAQSYSSNDFHHSPSRDMQQQSYYPPDDNHDNVQDFRTYQRASPGGNEFHPQYSSQPRSPYPDEGLYGPEVATYMNSRHPTQTIMQESGPNLYREPSTYEEQHDRRHFENSIAQPDPRRQSPLRQLMSPDDDRPSYSAMQPTVEDENDDGPPPPPPVHRTAIGRNMPSSSSIDTGYKPYSPQESTSPHPDFRDHHRQSSISPAEQDLAVSMAKPSQVQTRPPYPQSAGISVPSSLAAGYDAAKDQVDGSPVQSADPRYGYSSGATTSMEPARYIPNTAQPQTAVMKVQRSSPTPIMDRARSISPNPRPLSYRKSVSPRPPSSDERDVSSVPFSPDSFDSYNPRRSPSATRETGSQYTTHDRTVETAKPGQADLDDGPIIGDDGRLIDPSDHLPSESWAPEPEKKTKKPEVIVRFKHNPQNSSYASRTAARDPHYSAPTAPTAPDIAIRSGMRPRSTYVVQQPRQGYERHQRTSTTTLTATSYTPPRQSTRDFERRDPYSQSPQHQVHSPTTYDTPPRRRSVSPNPQMRSSPIYSYADSGPPLPAKVPIAAPVSSYAGHGMDALSQEIQSIDIGPGGYDDSRGVRRYQPRVSVSGGGSYR